MTLTLPKKAPRDYPMIEGFRGRVWRNAFSLYARECTLLCALLLLFSFLLDIKLGVEIGLLGFIISMLITALATLYINIKRVQVIRSGEPILAVIIEKKKLNLWHEMFRAKAHRSFKIRYRFTHASSSTDAQSKSIESSFYLCQCAYEHLTKDEEILLTVNPDKISHNVPLRIAVMRIPH